MKLHAAVVGGLKVFGGGERGATVEVLFFEEAFQVGAGVKGQHLLSLLSCLGPPERRPRRLRRSSGHLPQLQSCTTRAKLSFWQFDLVTCSTFLVCCFFRSDWTSAGVVGNKPGSAIAARRRQTVFPPGEIEVVITLPKASGLL